MGIKAKNLLKKVNYSTDIRGGQLLITVSSNDLNALPKEDHIDFFLAVLKKHLEDTVSIAFPIAGMLKMNKHQRREALEQAFQPKDPKKIITQNEKKIVNPRGQVIQSDKFGKKG